MQRIIQLRPYCTWLRRDTTGLLRAGILSVWLPKEFPGLDAYGTNGYAFISTYPNRPLPALQQGCARAWSRILSPPLGHDRDPALLWGGRSGAEKGGTNQRSDARPSGAQRPTQRGLERPRGKQAPPPTPQTSGQRRVSQRMKTTTTHRRIYTRAS